MPVAIAGITTPFTLNTIAPIQIAGSNSGRTYGKIENLDYVNGVWYAFGTNNGAAKNACHWLGPRRYFEFPVGRVIQGDLSAIADAGTPIISWIEE